MVKRTPNDRSKEQWHYARAGTGMPASLSRGIKYGYEAELKNRGVHDSEGKTTPLNSEAHENKFKQQPLNHTKLLNVGHDDVNVKTGPEVEHHSRGFAFRE